MSRNAGRFSYKYILQRIYVEGPLSTKVKKNVKKQDILQYFAKKENYGQIETMCILFAKIFCSSTFIKCKSMMTNNNDNAGVSEFFNRNPNKYKGRNNMRKYLDEIAENLNESCIDENFEQIKNNLANLLRECNVPSFDYSHELLKTDYDLKYEKVYEIRIFESLKFFTDPLYALAWLIIISLFPVPIENERNLFIENVLPAFEESEKIKKLKKYPTHDNTNELAHLDDTINISFVKKMLYDDKCTEMRILSIQASYCVFGDLSVLIKKRLCDDTGFVFKLIIANPNNDCNLQKWYSNIDLTMLKYASETYKKWANEYPNRFILCCTDIPITNRIYYGNNNDEMYVDHLIIPGDTNLSRAEIVNKKENEELYKIYDKLFDDIFSSPPVTL